VEKSGWLFPDDLPWLDPPPRWESTTWARDPAGVRYRLHAYQKESTVGMRWLAVDGDRRVAKQVVRIINRALRVVHRLRAATVVAVEVYQVDEDGEEFVHAVGADNRNEARRQALAIHQQISAGDFHQEPL
jgi:hypothetical protein